MSMNFDDIKSASRMRSIIERIAEATVTRMRPDVRIGQVHHFDPGQHFAWVLFPGETDESLVKVRIAQDQTPTRDIVTYGTDADVVRVLGSPGNYWITDFVSGLPQSPHLKPGSLVRYGGLGIPDGYLPADGTEVSQTQWPALYAAYGNKYGTASAGNFRLPLFHKVYDDVDPITSGLFTAAAGWAVDSVQLRVRNSMVYLQITVHATAAITFANVDHTNTTVATPTATMLNYVPDIQANAVAGGAIRTGVLTLAGNVTLNAGVVSNGSTLSGNIANGDSFTFAFFYPMPDDVAGLNGEIMLVKT